MGRTLLGAVLKNKAPVPYVPSGTGRRNWLPSASTTGGMVAQMQAQGQVGTLFAIVDRIITAYSQVEWKLYRVPKDGRRRYSHDFGTGSVQDNRIEITKHPALTLWNRPNPFFFGSAFRESAQQHEELTGEQYWIIVRNAVGLPEELWFVRPDRMEPVADSENFLVGYIYRGPAGEMVPLDKDDVIFLRRPHPLDPYRGIGAVQSILGDLDATYLSTQYNRNFFMNSATPGGIIEAENNISDEDFNQFQARWAETHKGVANAHRVAILEAGMKWVDRKYTMDDMQFVELREASRETIREAFGFPKAMTGATDDVNKANAYAGEVMFARWMTKPRLMRAKEALNALLLPMYGRSAAGLEFDFVNPVPEDDEIAATVLMNKAQAAKFLADTGLWEAQSITEVCGLPQMQELPEPRTPAKAPALPPAKKPDEQQIPPERPEKEPPEEATNDVHRTGGAAAFAWSAAWDDGPGER
jgi:HK97 family phage portal protein